MANILIVDDDEIMIKTLNASLVKAGHTVFIAKEGHTALEISEKENLHLIVTDINLPHGLNGFMLVKKFREAEKTAKLPIMIISSRRSQADVVKGIEAGVDDYVIKPIDFDIFNAKVSSLLTRSEHSFTLSRIQAQGILNMPVPMEIIGISEEGIQVMSVLPLEANHKMTIESKLFDDIGINPPVLRVAHCEKLEDETRPYTIKANFIGLTSGDLQKVRLYASKARIKGLS